MTAAALEFTLASVGISPTSGQHRHLVERYDHLPPHADAAPALRALAGRGFKLAVLSNATPDMIAACLANSWLDAWISHRLSGPADPRRARCPARPQWARQFVMSCAHFDSSHNPGRKVPSGRLRAGAQTGGA